MAPRHPDTAPLVIEQLKKSFLDVTALDGVSLSLQPGKVLALLGPSGCGKTTLLRCIAGLLPADSGTITIAGARVSGPGVFRPPEARELGMVFQDYALWPHMTAAENVGFPLAMRGYSKAERQEQVLWALDTVGLGAFADRPPETLSGGQQQRVALARAIVARPRLLLMDEPLSNLDKGLRESLALDIRDLINELGLSAVFVTHDQHEAFALADEVAILQHGQLQQIASPTHIYDSPANPGIAEFLDTGALIPGRFTGQGFVSDAEGIRFPIVSDEGFQGPATLLLPRRALDLSQHENAQISAHVRGVIFQGEYYAIRLMIGKHIGLTLNSQNAPLVDSHTGLNIRLDTVRAWDGDDRAMRLRHAAPDSHLDHRMPDPSVVPLRPSQRNSNFPNH